MIELPQMNRWPPGAIRKRRLSNTEVYRVRPYSGSIEKIILKNIDLGWFAPLWRRNKGEFGLGFVFDNYFHALAYSLKMKALHKKEAHNE